MFKLVKISSLALPKFKTFNPICVALKTNQLGQTNKSFMSSSDKSNPYSTDKTSTSTDKSNTSADKSNTSTNKSNTSTDKSTQGSKVEQTSYQQNKGVNDNETHGSHSRTEKPSMTDDKKHTQTAQEKFDQEALQKRNNSSSSTTKAQQDAHSDSLHPPSAGKTLGVGLSQDMGQNSSVGPDMGLGSSSRNGSASSMPGYGSSSRGKTSGMGTTTEVNAKSQQPQSSGSTPGMGSFGSSLGSGYPSDLGGKSSTSEKASSSTMGSGQDSSSVKDHSTIEGQKNSDIQNEANKKFYPEKENQQYPLQDDSYTIIYTSQIDILHMGDKSEIKEDASYSTYEKTEDKGVLKKLYEKVVGTSTEDTQQQLDQYKTQINDLFKKYKVQGTDAMIQDLINWKNHKST